jgi:hypothetical protein
MHCITEEESVKKHDVVYFCKIKYYISHVTVTVIKEISKIMRALHVRPY